MRVDQTGQQRVLAQLPNLVDSPIRIRLGNAHNQPRIRIHHHRRRPHGIGQNHTLRDVSDRRHPPSQLTTPPQPRKIPPWAPRRVSFRCFHLPSPCSPSAAALRLDGTVLAPAATAPILDYALQGNTEPVHDPSIIRQGLQLVRLHQRPARSSPRPAPAHPLLAGPRHLDPLRQRVRPDAPIGSSPKIPRYAPSGRRISPSSTAFITSITRLRRPARNILSSGSPPTSPWTAPMPGGTSGSIAARSSNLIRAWTSTPSTPASSSTPIAGYGLTFGSFWSGIKQVEIDPGTGMPIKGAKRFSLAARRDFADAIEGRSTRPSRQLLLPLRLHRRLLQRPTSAPTTTRK